MPSKNTKKKLKESAKSAQPAKVAEETAVEVSAQEALEMQEEVKETETKATEQKAKTTKAKQKAKKPSKVKQKTKEVFSELKKVNWPTFAQVAKKTAVVLVVVAVFAVVLLGFHTLLELVYTAFLGGLVK